MSLFDRVKSSVEKTVQRATEALEGDGPSVQGDVRGTVDSPHAATPSRRGTPTGKVTIDMVALKKASREELFSVVHQLNERIGTLETRGQKLFEAYKKEKANSEEANAKCLVLSADLGELRESSSKSSDSPHLVNKIAHLEAELQRSFDEQRALVDAKEASNSGGIVALQSQLASAQENMRQMDEERKRLEQALVDAKARAQQLVGDMEQANERVEQMQGELDASKDDKRRIAELEQELGAKEEECVANAGAAASANERIAELEDDKKRLLDDIAEAAKATDASDAAEQARQEAVAERDTLKAKVDNLTLAVDEANAKCATLSQELEHAHEQAENQAQSRADGAEKERAELDAQLSRALDEKDALAEELAATKEAVAQDMVAAKEARDVVDAQLSIALKEKDALAQELAAAKDAKIGVEEALVKAEGAAATASAVLTSATQKLKDALADKESALAEVDALKREQEAARDDTDQEHNEWMGRCQRAEAQATEWKDKCREAETAAADAAQRCAELESQVSGYETKRRAAEDVVAALEERLRASQAEASAVVEKCAALSQELSARADEAVAAKATVDGLESALAEQVDIVAALTAERDDAVAQCGSLQMDLRDGDALRKELEKQIDGMQMDLVEVLTAERDEVAAQCASLQVQMKDVQEALDVAQHKADELEAELSSRGDPEELQMAMAALQKKCAESEGKVEELTRALRDVEDNMTQSRENHKAEVDDLHEEVSQLQQRVEAQDKALAQARADVDHAATALAKVRQDAVEQAERHAAEIAALDTQVEMLTHELESKADGAHHADLETDLALATEAAEAMRREFSGKESKWRDMLTKAKAALDEKTKAVAMAEESRAKALEAEAAAAGLVAAAIEQRDVAMRDSAALQAELEAARTVSDEQADEQTAYRQRAQAALQRAEEDRARLIEQLQDVTAARAAESTSTDERDQLSVALEQMRADLEHAQAQVLSAVADKDASEAALAETKEAARLHAQKARQSANRFTALAEEQAAQLQRLQDQLREAEQRVIVAEQERDVATQAAVSLASAPATPVAAPAVPRTPDIPVADEAPAPSLHHVEQLKTLDADLRNAKQRLAELSQSHAELEHEQSLHLQQAKLLKDRIRELERSEERSATVNMEYLKNVVVKYIELCGPPSGDLMQHEILVPVIATCLKLSPEEKKRCQKEAVGWGGWLASTVASAAESAAAASARASAAP